MIDYPEQERINDFLVKSRVNGKILVKMCLQWDEFVAKYTPIYGSKWVEEIAIDRSANMLKYYVPTGAHEQYIDMIVRSVETTDQPVVALFGANSIGKTCLEVNILGNVVYGCQNGWFDYPLFWNYPFKKLHWHASDKNAILDAFIRTLKEYMPYGRYEVKADDQRSLPFVLYDTGWETKTKSFDQDPKQYESSETGLQTIDEPCPEIIWDALKQRTRGGGIACLCLTPLECDPYIQDEIDGAAEGGIYSKMTAEIYSCCKERGIRGFRSKRSVDDTVSKMKPDERESRALGKFMFYSEQIYPTYRRERHFRNPEDFPIDFGIDPIYMTVDPHDSRPCACTYCAVKPNGRIIFFAETPLDKSVAYWEQKRVDETFEDEIQRWMELEDNFGVKRVYMRVMDKFFGWQTKRQGTIAADFLHISMRLGRQMNFVKSYSGNSQEVGELTFGHNCVRKALENLDDGEPGLIVWNTCYHIDNGFRHYVRKRAKNQYEHQKAQGDTSPIEKYKDFNDGVRYPVSAIFLRNPNLYKLPENNSAKTKISLDKIRPHGNRNIIGVLKSRMKLR